MRAPSQGEPPSGPPQARPERLWQQTLTQLAQAADDGMGLDMILPFCAAHCLCCDRQVFGSAPVPMVDDYIEDLCREAQTLARHLLPRRRLQAVHLGGGSSTELSDAQWCRLIDALRRTWQLDPGAEVSAQCDPRRLVPRGLKLLRSLGVTRLSLGVLDLDPEVQRAAGRSLSPALIADVCQQAADCGFDDLQFDLTVGLPMQDSTRWQHTLDQVLALAPRRLHLSQHRHRPRQVAGHAVIDADRLPDRTQVRQLQRLAQQVLQGAGYQAVGGDLHLRADVDPSTLPGLRPRMPMLGCGAGAASLVGGRVYVNENQLEAWQALVRVGRLPVMHTRQLAWYQPGERLRDSVGRDAVAWRSGLAHGLQAPDVSS